MLLPKRVKRNMIKKGINPNEVLLRKLIKLQNFQDFILLDPENALIVFEEENNTIIVHERLENCRLITINQWSTFATDYSKEMITIINQLALLKKANHRNDYNMDYTYKNGNYILKNEIWNSISFKGIKDLFSKYRCALGCIKISSDYEEDDTYTYISPLTGEKITESFEVSDGNYYAILNYDGTIRGNRLFRGNSFSKAEEKINLEEHESLEAFLQMKKDWCNEQKQRNKKYFQEMLTQKGDSGSPYLEEEIIQTLKLNK